MPEQEERHLLERGFGGGGCRLHLETVHHDLNPNAGDQGEAGAVRPKLPAGPPEHLRILSFLSLCSVPRMKLTETAAQ